MIKGLIAATITALLTVAALTVADEAGATGDTYRCPPGTVHDYKIDNLSGPTFTVPTPPDGWRVVGVVVKAGRDHHLYAPVTPGQTLDVKADTGHDISHAHICKDRSWNTTTSSTSTSTTAAPTSTSTTSTTTPTPSSTSPSSTSTSVATTTAPTTSTSTSTSSPSTTSPATTSTTSSPTSTVPASTSTTTATIPPATSPTPSLPTPDPDTTLPPTGDSARALGVGAITLILLGGLAVFVVRRPK